MIDTLAASREANSGLSLFGFVVTLFDDRLRSHRDGVQQLREGYKEGRVIGRMHGYRRGWAWAI